MSTESGNLPVVRVVVDEAYEIAAGDEARRELADLMRMGRKNGLHLGGDRHVVQCPGPAGVPAPAPAQDDEFARLMAGMTGGTT